ncbi:Hypothetical protein CINCED_3A020128 [Cinara cedri]|uniref:Uncharacterized protein n=1 Tax=Cinara cedri TaxID=506608 RepID=A0A5E4N252_9HEMI|nr:Hypothetical protein CINCED_3A020128 [Cinara cedri]
MTRDLFRNMLGLVGVIWIKLLDHGLTRPFSPENSDVNQATGPSLLLGDCSAIEQHDTRFLTLFPLDLNGLMFQVWAFDEVTVCTVERSM